MDKNQVDHVDQMPYTTFDNVQAKIMGTWIPISEIDRLNAAYREIQDANDKKTRYEISGLELELLARDNHIKLLSDLQKGHEGANKQLQDRLDHTYNALAKMTQRCCLLEQERIYLKQQNKLVRKENRRIIARVHWLDNVNRTLHNQLDNKLCRITTIRESPAESTSSLESTAELKITKVRTVKRTRSFTQNLLAQLKDPSIQMEIQDNELTMDVASN